jgi:hypothetical protein
VLLCSGRKEFCYLSVIGQGISSLENVCSSKWLRRFWTVFWHTYKQLIWLNFLMLFQYFQIKLKRSKFPQFKECACSSLNAGYSMLTSCWQHNMSAKNISFQNGLRLFLYWMFLYDISSPFTICHPIWKQNCVANDIKHRINWWTRPINVYQADERQIW